MCKLHAGVVIIILTLFQVGLFSDNDVTEEVKHPAYFKEEWEKQEYPNPMSEDGSFACGNRGKKYFVCDPAMALDKAEVAEIAGLISRWHSIARCPCVTCREKGPFFLIMVAIMPKIKDQPDKDELSVTVEFAEYLLKESWDFARCEDSIVIVLSVTDQLLWTAVGAKVKDLLTTSCIGDIFEENRSLLASGLFGKAIENMVSEYIAVLKEDRDCKFEWPSWWKYPAIVFITLIVLLFCGDQLSGYVFHRRLFTCMDQLFRKGRFTRPEPGYAPSDSSVHSTFSETNPPTVHEIHSLSHHEIDLMSSPTETSESDSYELIPSPLPVRDRNEMIFFVTDGKHGCVSAEYTATEGEGLDTKSSSDFSIYEKKYF